MVVHRLRAAAQARRERSADLASAERAVRLLAEAFQSGEPGELDHVIGLLRQQLDADPDYPGRPAVLWAIALVLENRIQQTGDQADLDALVAVSHEGLAATPADHPDRASWLAGLPVALLRRYEGIGDQADLDEAISVLREGLAVVPAGHPNRIALLSNLSAALTRRFEWAGAPADLEEAVRAVREGLAAVPEDHPGHAVMLAILGTALTRRAEQRGDPADLDQAIAALREGLAATPDDSPERARWLSSFSAALTRRFERAGSRADLEEAVTAARQAVQASPIGRPSRCLALANLGTALFRRSEQMGSLADLDEGITVIRQAIQLSPAGHPEQATRLSALGMFLTRRFQQAGEHVDLDEAVSVARMAIEATPDGHAERSVRLATLSHALQARFDENGDHADLDEAVSVARLAVDATPDGHPERARWLAGLGMALQTRFDETEERGDLDEAVAAARQAVRDAPAGHPDQARWLVTLGMALQARFDENGEHADLDEAVSAARQATEMEVAAPRVRAIAANLWGWAAGLGGRWEEAIAGFDAAAALLGLVASRGLERRDQEHLLETLDGLAADAAACCVRAGLPDRGVELFEQSHGVLLGQALDSRTDLTALAADHPGLAGRFADLRDGLEAGSGTLSARREIERRRELVEEFGALIEEIRVRPGFAGFLRPLPVRDLAAAAQDGPVVIVTVSRFGSHALILTRDGVLEPVPLEGLTPSRAQELVTAFLDALEERRGNRAAEHELTSMLEQMWDAVAEPVLDRLGLTGPPSAGAPWPRLWWCVPGMLSFLPWHAAGHHETRSDLRPRTVADCVISSYTPTIRALIHARRPGAAGLADAGERLVVAMPQTPGVSDLPGAQAEADLLRQRFGGSTVTLVGADATRHAVLEAMPRASWVHFSCHGYASLASPSASYLLLYDHEQRPLTVTDVTQLRLEAADLAFLSACSTASPGTRLADEAIHLTSAFQLAGYRHVIGTLWPISDYHSVQLTSDLYEALAAAGTAAAAAAALHEVTRGLRDKWLRAPSLWAAHIHAGA